MKIGLIGAGYVGRTLAQKAREAGHDVMISNSRGPETLLSTKYALGCQAGTAEEAARFGDIVIIAVPLTALDHLPLAPLANKIVIDTGNYYPERDGRIPELDRLETTTSEMLAKLLPGSRVTKAFNAIRMIDLERIDPAQATSDRWALPLSGDFPEDKAKIIELMDSFGLDAVDAGALSEGWRFERGMPVYCIRHTRTDLKARLAEASQADRTGALAA